MTLVNFKWLLPGVMSLYYGGTSTEGLCFDSAFQSSCKHVNCSGTLLLGISAFSMPDA